MAVAGKIREKRKPPWIEIKIGRDGPSALEVEESCESLAKVLKKRFSWECPPHRVVHSSSLGRDEYSIRLSSGASLSWSVKPGHLLAIGYLPRLRGFEPTDIVKEPLFKVDATWIPEDQEGHASRLGFICFDSHSVVLAHFHALLRGELRRVLTSWDTIELATLAMPRWNRCYETVTFARTLFLLDLDVDFGAIGIAQERARSGKRTWQEYFIWGKLWASPRSVGGIILEPEFEDELEKKFRSSSRGFPEISEVFMEMLAPLGLCSLPVAFFCKPGLAASLGRVMTETSQSWVALSKTFLHGESPPQLKVLGRLPGLTLTRPRPKIKLEALQAMVEYSQLWPSDSEFLIPLRRFQFGLLARTLAG